METLVPWLILWWMIGAFVPSAISAVRQHKNTVAISVLAILAGWTFVGFVAAMVWSFTDHVRKNNDRYLNKHGVGSFLTIEEWSSVSEDEQKKIKNLHRQVINVALIRFSISIFSLVALLLIGFSKPSNVHDVGFQFVHFLVLTFMSTLFLTPFCIFIPVILKSQYINSVAKRVRSLPK